MTTDERDRLILSYLEHCQGLLHFYAASAHLEYDDLYQDATLVVMHCLARKPDQARDLQAYIHTSIRNRILNKIRDNKVRKAESLDAPLSGENDLTLADLLPSPYSIEPLTLLVAKERLLSLQLAQVTNRQRAARLSELRDTALASVSGM